MMRKKRSGMPIGRAGVWLLISLLLTIGLLLPGNTVGADDPIPTPASEQPTQWRVTTVENLVDAQEVEGSSRSNPKLGSSLNQLLEAHRREGLAEAQVFATTHMMVLDDDRVQVVIVTTPEAISDLKEAVEALGGEYQGHYETLLQALVPIDTLESLAGRLDVQLVREPRRPIPAAPMQIGDQTTEGVAASNASAWHTAGYDGTGVRVAVIDAGFTDYADMLDTDLPPSVTTYDWTGSGMGGSSHGTACAEIVYDMAYGATMYLHKISTVVELNSAVTQAIADDVDIISMSLGWTINGPGDGTGSLANIVNNARSNGIFFAVAAGNEAEVSWSGTYVDSGTGDFHAWDGASLWYNFIVLTPGTGYCYVPPAGTPIRAGLHWDDWSTVNQDYDLHLYRYPGGSTIYRVASSTNPQNGGGGQTPEEFVAYTAAGGNCYAIVVERVNASRDVCLSLDVPQMPHLEEWVTQRSLSFPADSPDAITVGAVDVGSPYPLESYSSRGPTFGPGGTCSGGSTKPDIAAYANVSTVSYGAGVFNGTSAATPHVAGAAALVKDVYPGYSVTQLQNYLENEAMDLGAAGKDNLYGSGRLFLPDLNNPPNLPSNPSPADGATGVSINADLSWTGGDPDPGDTVTYDVYFEANDSTPDNLICNDVSAPACDPGTLAYGTHYYWYVRATDNHGASTTGDTWDFYTGSEPNDPPYQPGNPTPANGATDQDINVDLDWTGGDPDAGDTVTYDVYFEADDSTPDNLICNDVSTPACDPGTLVHDTHYYWYVVATDNHDASTTGDTWDFTTAPSQAPPPPTIDSITPNSGYNNQVVHITDLAGSNFQSGATATLTKTGQAVISATNVVVVSDSQITCDFDLRGAYPGTWTVRVTNPDTEYAELADGFTVRGLVYLPSITRCWPQVAYLEPIDNPDGDGVYTLSWSWPSCAPSPSYYQLRADDDPQFGSPDTFTEDGTTFEAYSPTPTTYYWQVRAYLSGTGWGEWGNVQSVTVTDWRAYVWVDNDTGGNLTVEIVGIEKKSFSTGTHYWRNIPPGRYTYKAWARCGSGSWTDDFVAGENVLSFWCSYSTPPTSKALLGGHDVSWSRAIRDLGAVR